MFNKNQQTISRLSVGGGGPPDGDSLEAERLLQLVFRLGVASRTIRRRLAGLAGQFDLGEHELLVLWQCRTGGRAQSELAVALGISPAQVSGLVDRLREEGLLELQRQDQDRRRHVWRLSLAGRQRLMQAMPHLEAMARELSRELSSEDQQRLLTLCQRLVPACLPVSDRPDHSTPESPANSHSPPKAA